MEFYKKRVSFYISSNLALKYVIKDLAREWFKIVEKAGIKLHLLPQGFGNTVRIGGIYEEYTMNKRKSLKLPLLTLFTVILVFIIAPANTLIASDNVTLDFLEERNKHLTEFLRSNYREGDKIEDLPATFFEEFTEYSTSDISYTDVNNARMMSNDREYYENPTYEISRDRISSTVENHSNGHSYMTDVEVVYFSDGSFILDSFKAELPDYMTPASTNDITLQAAWGEVTGQHTQNYYLKNGSWGARAWLLSTFKYNGDRSYSTYKTSNFRTSALFWAENQHPFEYFPPEKPYNGKVSRVQVYSRIYTNLTNQLTWMNTLTVSCTANGTIYKKTSLV